MKLHHPLWTHLPALVMVLLMLVALVRVVSLPDPLPVDPDTSQRPDHSGAVCGIVALVFISLSWIGITVVWDELWARLEHRKAFNGWSLMDELVVGMAGGGMLTAFLGRVGAASDFPFSVGFMWFIPAVATAAVLEALRPFRPMDERLSADDTGALEADIAQRTAAGERWTYWEMHNPGWQRAAWLLAAVLTVAATLVPAGELPWQLLAVAGAALGLIVLLRGGLRVAVSSDRVQVRVGLLRFRLFDVKVADITDVRMDEFSPFRESRPLMWRWGAQPRACCLGTRHVVKLQTRQGKQYLIGSDHPERLAAVIGATLRATASTERTEK